MEIVLALFGLVVAVWMILSSARRHRGQKDDKQDKR